MFQAADLTGFRESFTLVITRPRTRPGNQQRAQNLSGPGLILSRKLLVDPEEFLPFVEHTDESAEAGTYIYLAAMVLVHCEGYCHLQPIVRDSRQYNQFCFVNPFHCG